MMRSTSREAVAVTERAGVVLLDIYRDGSNQPGEQAKTAVQLLR
jgi:hypothetical protein